MCFYFGGRISVWLDENWISESERVLYTFWFGEWKSLESLLLENGDDDKKEDLLVLLMLEGMLWLMFACYSLEIGGDMGCLSSCSCFCDVRRLIRCYMKISRADYF